MDKITALKEIATATSLRSIKEILKQVGQKPSPELAKEEEKATTKKWVKYLLVVGAILFISAVTYMAWVGGDYIFDYAGFIAIFFGILDTILILLLASNFVKGKMRYGILIFEIGSLAYLGYAMSGYFGGGNLRTATETKLMTDYEIVNDYRTNIQSIADQAMRAAQNAGQIAQIEFARDGKGVVYEKGMMVSGMNIDSIPPVKLVGKIPNFKSISEANKFLHQKRQELAENITSIKSVGIAIQEQAKGVDAGLQQAIAMGLSDQQKNNLQVLSGTLQAITKTPINDGKISDAVLSPKDLKADGFQGYIGYIIDIIIIFFIVMIALQKDDDADIEKIRESEAKSLIQDILSDENIPYDPDRLSQSKLKHLFDAVKTVTSDDSVKVYVKKQMSFNEFLEFIREYPVLAKSLGESKWPFRDIKKEIESNADFLSVAQEAIKLQPSEWRSVNSFITDPAMVLEMDDSVRKSFVTMLTSLSTKLQKPEKIKEFMGKFVKSYSTVSPVFLKTLEICIEKIPAPQLANLTPEFVKSTSPDVANHLLSNVDYDSNKISNIIRSWKEQTNDDYERILNNGIVQQGGFESFWFKTIKDGGQEGLLAMMRSYFEKKKECSETTIGNRIVVVEPNQIAINESLQKLNKGEGSVDEYLKLIKDAFKAKAETLN